MNNITFTRQELYNLVWETPLNQIAVKYDIAKSDIKRACTALKVPLPTSSYWRNFNFKPLPELAETFLEKKSIEIPVSINKKQLRKSSKSGLDFDLAIKILNDLDFPLYLPKKLDNPSEILEVKRKQGMENSLYDEFFSQILNLDIAQSSTLRVLVFLDTLIKLLSFRGHEVQINTQHIGLVFIKEGKSVELSIREGCKKVFCKSSYKKWTLEFTGQFIVKIKCASVRKEFRQINVLKESSLARIAAIIELSES